MNRCSPDMGSKVSKVDHSLHMLPLIFSLLQFIELDSLLVCLLAVIITRSLSFPFLFLDATKKTDDEKF